MSQNPNFDFSIFNLGIMDSEDESALNQNIESKNSNTASNEQQTIPFPTDVKVDVSLSAPQSVIKRGDTTLTYLNQGQNYVLKLGYPKKWAPKNGLELKTYIKLGFEDKEMNLIKQDKFKQWFTENTNKDLFELSASKGSAVSRIEKYKNSRNKMVIFWNAKQDSSPSIKVNCLSSDFCDKRSGGESGIIMTIKVSTFIAIPKDCKMNLNLKEQYLHSCKCAIKVFRSRGAERKYRQELNVYRKEVESHQKKIEVARKKYAELKYRRDMNLNVINQKINILNEQYGNKKFSVIEKQMQLQQKEKEISLELKKQQDEIKFELKKHQNETELLLKQQLEQKQNQIKQKENELKMQLEEKQNQLKQKEREFRIQLEEKQNEVRMQLEQKQNEVRMQLEQKQNQLKQKEKEFRIQLEEKQTEVRMQLEKKQNQLKQKEKEFKIQLEEKQTEVRMQLEKKQNEVRMQLEQKQNQLKQKEKEFKIQLEEKQTEVRMQLELKANEIKLQLEQQQIQLKNKENEIEMQLKQEQLIVMRNLDLEKKEIQKLLEQISYEEEMERTRLQQEHAEIDAIIRKDNSQIEIFEAEIAVLNEELNQKFAEPSKHTKFNEVSLHTEECSQEDSLDMYTSGGESNIMSPEDLNNRTESQLSIEETSNSTDSHILEYTTDIETTTNASELNIEPLTSPLENLQNIRSSLNSVKNDLGNVRKTRTIVKTEELPKKRIIKNEPTLFKIPKDEEIMMDKNLNKNGVNLWLNDKGFEDHTVTFLNYDGDDIIELEKEDTLLLCGAADGCRLFNKIKNFKDDNLIQVYMNFHWISDEDFVTIYLQKRTLEELIHEIKLNGKLGEIDINKTYIKKQSGIKVLLNEKDIPRMRNESAYSVKIESCKDTEQLYNVIMHENC